MPERIRRSKKRENVNKPASLSRSQKLLFFPQFRMTLSRTRTLMNSVRHHDAPVMPLGHSVFAPDLRHLVGDSDLQLHRDQFLMAIIIIYTYALTVSIFFSGGNNLKKKPKG